MRQMLNVLYVTTEDAYLSLNGECVEIHVSEAPSKKYPLHILEGIVCFSYKGASPALLGKCAELGISVAFLSPNSGRFLASTSKGVSGNVLLRREQYRIADSEERSIGISRNMMLGKLYNSRAQLQRVKRDHPLQVDVDAMIDAINHIGEYIQAVKIADDKSKLRGIEGNAAADYFAVFDEMILQRKEEFEYRERSRRPPMNRTNAMLSFGYTLLANECAAALNSVGLDPYVGFFHTDRSGRESLSLDLMEELRAIYVDRFVLSLINNRIIKPNQFETKETGAVYLNEKGRKVFLSAWQERKREELKHPYLDISIPWGLVPYSQALLLARYIRGDIDSYPPFFWK